MVKVRCFTPLGVGSAPISEVCDMATQGGGDTGTNHTVSEITERPEAGSALHMFIWTYRFMLQSRLGVVTLLKHIEHLN